MSNKNIKVALVIKTNGLEYDDRVRKEIVTVSTLFPNISFKIFAMLPVNEEREGITGCGTPYKTIYIPARDKYGPSQKTFLKSYQFYKAVKDDLKSFDIVWAADNSATIFPLLLKSDKLLWDLHELPSDILGIKGGKYLLRYIFHRCKLLIHANQQRIDYLKEVGVITQPEKHYVIRNYPNFDDIDKEYDQSYTDFVKWKNERRCVYLQGLANDSRSAYETVSAVMKFPDLCAVVVGGFDAKIKIKLIGEFGDSLTERIRFVGSIAQLKIPQYVKQCFMSLIFYKNANPNNYYCEANRFYQSVILGLPVVVGNNPSMKELVNQYGFGVAIDDDGRDVAKMVDGMKQIMEHYDEYCGNIEKNKHFLYWDNQNDMFIKIINRLLDEG